MPPHDLFHSLGPMQPGTRCAPSATRRACARATTRAQDAYDTTAVEHGVGCEACHGPGEAHVAWARGRAPGAPRAATDAMGLVSALKEPRPARVGARRHAAASTEREPPGDPRPHVDLCGRCHSRRGTHLRGRRGRAARRHASRGPARRRALLPRRADPGRGLRARIVPAEPHVPREASPARTATPTTPRSRARRAPPRLRAATSPSATPRARTPSTRRARPARAAWTATCPPAPTWWCTRGATTRSASRAPT